MTLLHFKLIPAVYHRFNIAVFGVIWIQFLRIRLTILAIAELPLVNPCWTFMAWKSVRLESMESSSRRKDSSAPPVSSITTHTLIPSTTLLFSISFISNTSNAGISNCQDSDIIRA